jgi:hypothetical protein
MGHTWWYVFFFNIILGNVSTIIPHKQMWSKCLCLTKWIRNSRYLLPTPENMDIFRLRLWFLNMLLLPEFKSEHYIVSLGLSRMNKTIYLYTTKTSRCTVREIRFCGISIFRHCWDSELFSASSSTNHIRITYIYILIWLCRNPVYFTPPPSLLEQTPPNLVCRLDLKFLMPLGNF